MEKKPNEHLEMKIHCLAAAFLVSTLTANAQLIVSDNYNVAGNGTGFAINSGINSAINPPATRLTGLASTNLRYIATESKPASAFSIAGNKLQITPASSPGRFVLSADGTASFDFAPALGVNSATPQNPAVYDLRISLANNSPDTQRFSFALSASEGSALTWDFGFQIYRTAASDDFYTIGKRIDAEASGLDSDLNSFITNTAVGTGGSEVTLLMRVTDAGAASFNSRAQLSLDDGVTWFYDTASDPDLPNDWRLNGPERHIIWDVAPNAGPVTYDNFSVRLVPLSAALVSPANNAQNIGASPTLIATVSNLHSENVTVTFFGRELPKPGPGPDFLIPVLPDTQNYARESSGSGNATKEMWFAQTEWIITNRVAKNIPFVATLGDCVNTAGTLSQWKNATNAYYRLEDSARTLLGEGIPYGVTVGNHDQSPNGDENGDTTYYNQFFGESHFNGKSFYGGHYDANNDSWYDLFSAGGMDFLVISFEFGRYGSAIMDWARDVMAAHPNRRVIVLTHFAGQDVADVNNTHAPFGAQGQAIYTGLKTNANFFLMMSGHVFNDGGEGRRSDTFQGHTVHTLISDYQGRFNGGNGLMRLMYFSPSNNSVSVKTYSPYTDNFETDANSQFSFSYNMQPNGAGSPGTPVVPLATNANVLAGTQSSFVWTGLQANRSYEWFVKVTDDQGDSVFSSPRQFTTTINSAPVAFNQTVTIIGDQPTQLTLTASDINGDALRFQTGSSPIRGLNSDFNFTNGTVTYLPAHGYRGLDRFTFYVTDGFALSGEGTIDLNVIAPTDTNGNGLPDSWENSYGISDPNGDEDQDGQNNLAEYTANTNPTNAASLFKIWGASFQTNQTSGAFELSWSSVGGTRYRVQYSDNLTNGFTDVIQFIETEMDPAPYGAPSTQSFLDDFTFTGAPTNNARFYRVKVTP